MGRHSTNTAPSHLNLQYLICQTQTLLTKKCLCAYNFIVIIYYWGCSLFKIGNRSGSWAKFGKTFHQRNHCHIFGCLTQLLVTRGLSFCALMLYLSMYWIGDNFFVFRAKATTRHSDLETLTNVLAFRWIINFRLFETKNWPTPAFFEYFRSFQTNNLALSCLALGYDNSIKTLTIVNCGTAISSRNIRLGIC